MTGSRRYDGALAHIDLLQTKEAAAYLGIAVGWLRKHIRYTEWHHCYLKYGNGAVAYFWSKADLDAVRDKPDVQKAQERLARRGSKGTKP